MRALMFCLASVSICSLLCSCGNIDSARPGASGESSDSQGVGASTGSDIVAVDGADLEYHAPQMAAEKSIEAAGDAATVSPEPAAKPLEPNSNALARTDTKSSPPPRAIRSEAKRQPSAPNNETTEIPKTDHEGRGPGLGGDKYTKIYENPFRSVLEHPLSTFSIDVDTASYANTRRFLLQNNSLPPAGAVRIEELVNYFAYDYEPPTGDEAFATHIEIAACPWQSGNRLVRVGIKGRVIENEERPASNLVFLLDVSGSMQSSDKLPLLKQGMQRLVDQLGENDRVAIAVYASASGLVLPSTPAYDRATIRESLERLRAGGSTNGGEGIRLAYATAKQNFITGGTNRVFLCTDGDFNVGTTSTADLVDMVEREAKSGIFLTVLGFGRGNLNDAMMEEVSNHGNGNYAYIDSKREAEKVLVEQAGGTLVTIAKDVKIQIEFNPAEVGAYRLIGYENRMLRKEDFNDDTKDAGEIGAGHTVTALYEIVPADAKAQVAAATPPAVDDLEFQQPAALSEAAKSGQMLTLKLRHKQPDADKSTLQKFPVTDAGHPFGAASSDFKFAAAVAGFGMLLRDSNHKGILTYAAVREIAEANQEDDPHGYRAEFVEMVKRAEQISQK